MHNFYEKNPRNFEPMSFTHFVYYKKMYVLIATVLVCDRERFRNSSATIVYKGRHVTLQFKGMCTEGTTVLVSFPDGAEQYVPVHPNTGVEGAVFCVDDERCQLFFSTSHVQNSSGRKSPGVARCVFCLGGDSVDLFHKNEPRTSCSDLSYMYDRTFSPFVVNGKELEYAHGTKYIA